MSEFDRVDQVAIAVTSLDETSKVLKSIWGLELSQPETVESQGVRIQFANIGETRLEFMEPSGDATPISNFLKRRGEGIQHIAFAVKDLDATLKRLNENGVQLINKSPVQGAEGSRVAFIHPKSFFGVLLELIEDKS